VRACRGVARHSCRRRYTRSSLLAPRSSLLAPRSSLLAPRSSALEPCADADDDAFSSTIRYDPKQENSLSSTDEAGVLAAFPGHVDFLQAVAIRASSSQCLTSNLDVSAFCLGAIFAGGIP